MKKVKTDKDIIRYLRKQSKIHQTNFEVISNKYMALYIKYKKLKKEKSHKLQASSSKLDSLSQR